MTNSRPEHDYLQTHLQDGRTCGARRMNTGPDKNPDDGAFVCSDFVTENSNAEPRNTPGHHFSRFDYVRGCSEISGN